MSVASSLNEVQVKLSRVEYAIQAVENVHDGEECPDEDYCDRCREKMSAVVARLEELPRFVTVLLWIFAPRNSWRMKQELKALRASGVL